MMLTWFVVARDCPFATEKQQVQELQRETPLKEPISHLMVAAEQMRLLLLVRRFQRRHCRIVDHSRWYDGTRRV